MIPSDWDLTSMGKILEFQNGVNAPKSAYGVGTPFINVLEVVSHTFIEADMIPGKVSLGASEIEAFSVRQGDILFNRTSETQDEVGLAAVYSGNEPVVFGGFVIRARLVDSRLNPRFAAYALRGPSIRSQIIKRGQGAVRANIGQRDLARVQLPMPDQAEQLVIAECLSDADARIASLEQLLTKKRQIKQGATQELLTRKKRLPGFNGEWAVKRLDELGQWMGGTTPPMGNPKYWRNGTIPWISSGDVKSARLAATAHAVSPIAIKEQTTTLVPANSVILVMRSGILRHHLPVAINVKPMAINQDIKALLPNEDVLPEYLLHSVQHHGNDIRARCLKFGTTVESIEFPWLKSFLLEAPGRREQEAICAVLSDMDAEIAALEAKLAKARQIKQGMMQELLTGRIRLV